jgi:class 3 adenylate cyclase
MESPAFARPSGTVTFLFTDIEGSTQRWERRPDAMGVALARHNALVRDAIEAHGGYVFKTVGDAFCSAFGTATTALAAARAAQQALSEEDFSSVDGLPVRMALHTGHVEERDGDYLGSTVNRAARLLAIGHGGQVLVSQAATDLVQDSMLPESDLRDLGAHRLKDLTRAERVYQLVAPGLVATFPALRSIEHMPNNLPAADHLFRGP